MSRSARQILSCSFGPEQLISLNGTKSVSLGNYVFCDRALTFFPLQVIEMPRVSVYLALSIFLSSTLKTSSPTDSMFLSLSTV